MQIITTFELPYLSIVSPFYKNGDLCKYLENEGALEDEIVIKFSLGISVGIEFLHSNKILHRDLKSSNIFVC